MIKHKCKIKQLFFLGLLSSILTLSHPLTKLALAQQAPQEEVKPIVVAEPEGTIEERMQRTISLDVRDMNIVDVIKFLALKGEFNIILSPSVEGRSTVLLNSVTIKDALDIAIISNHMAYTIQSNIVNVMTSAEYESMYGRRFNDQTEVNIVRLKYSKPSYVLAALDGMKSNVGKIIIDEDTGSVVMIDTKDAVAQMKKAIEQIEKPLETFVYALQYAKADVIADKLRARIDAKSVGSITADERGNKLVIRAFPDRLKEVKVLLRELDSPTKEVMVDARVLQIVLKPEFDVGIDWQLDFKDSHDDAIKQLNFKNFYLGKSNNTLAASDNLFTKFGQIAIGNFDKNHFAVALSALKKVSDTKILSNPQILVTNGEEARIHIGDTVPYIISTTSGTGDSAITSEDVRFVDVGLKLNVIPTINDDGFVTMRLKPEISTVVGTVTSKGGGIPQVNKTEVETTVMVQDGNTIILGGLKRDDKVHNKKGFPGLMDVPFVGKAFSRTADTFAQTEIVIFITPHIVTGDHSYEAIKGAIKPFKSYSGEASKQE